MKPFQDFESQVVPLLVDNVDTDQIIPARFLKGTRRSGLGDGLFADRRGRGLALDEPRFQGGEILLAGENFGCGSSREHAAWALLEAGFRAVLSPRFADIFRGNALGNGLLPITLDGSTYRRLAHLVGKPESLYCRVDLAPQRLSWNGGAEEMGFDLDPFAKGCLQRGEDRLDYLLARTAAVEVFEARFPSPIDTRGLDERPGSVACSKEDSRS